MEQLVHEHINIDGMQEEEQQEEEQEERYASNA